MPGCGLRRWSRGLWVVALLRCWVSGFVGVVGVVGVVGGLSLETLENYGAGAWLYYALEHQQKLTDERSEHPHKRNNPQTQQPKSEASRQQR